MGSLWGLLLYVAPVGSKGPTSLVLPGYPSETFNWCARERRARMRVFGSVELT